MVRQCLFKIVHVAHNVYCGLLLLQVAGWSIGFYSQWLDDHTSEEEKLALIRQV